jgi:hypothetical protein
MADCQITCITKPHPLSPHEHISHVGNSISGWIITTELVIRNIELGIDTFFVIDPITGGRVDVGVRRLPGRRPFIQTYADGNWNNNLLSLNQCPTNLSFIQ